MYDDLNKNSGQGDLNRKFELSAKRTMTVDVDRYQKYLEGSELTDAEKDQFLQTMWQFIISFVELGYGVHPLQEVCGKNTGTLSSGAKDALDSNHIDKEGKPKRPNL